MQIYQWDGTNWISVVPDALLFADTRYEGTVGIHYAGPTWERQQSGRHGLRPLHPGAGGAIAWLLLRAVSNEGPGVFHRVTFIHRVNTVGGPPPMAGSS